MKRLAFILLLASVGLTAQTLNTPASAPATTAANVTTSTFASTTGDTFVVAIMHATQTVSSVVTFAGAGNACTAQYNKTDVSQIGAADLYVCQNVTGHASDSVKVTLSGSSANFAVVLLPYSGLITSGVVDQTAYAFNVNPFQTQTTPAFTTTAANEVIVSCIAIDVARGDQHGSGYVARVNDSNNTSNSSQLWCEDRTVTSLQVNTVAAFTGFDRFMIFAVSLKTIPPPHFTITKTHSGNFTQGDTGKTYTVTVGNNGPGSTVGTVTMTETAPAGLTVTAMAGTGWTCNTSTCTRSDVLASGGAYPAITVTVGVGATTQSPQVNQVSASGTNSPTATASDSTIINTSGSLLVSVTQRTQTQIAVSYTATSGSACTVAATDLNGGPDVSDVNPAKFTNANLDLSRTVANGFRWPTLVSGLNRIVFIGGHDEVKLGTDGKYYSTALQVNSQHSVTVVCDLINGGTVTPNTYNLPLASNFPEMPIPTPGSPLGGIPQPTIDWSRAGRDKTYPDPMTGILIKRITGGNDYMTDNPLSVTPTFQSTVIGSAWTNTGNFTTNQASGTLATTSTVNAPIFAAFVPTFDPDPNAHWTDFLITPYGSASSNSIVATFCPSMDSGQTCANYTPIDVTYTTSAQCQPAGNCANAVPSNTPSSFFDAWGGMKTAFGSEDWQNKQFVAIASASGSTVTLTAPDGDRGPTRFYMGLVPGSKFTMTSCSVGTQAAPLTVASVNNQGSITTVETGLALTNCTYTDMHSGIRAVMKNAGTLNLSFQMAAYQSRDGDGGTSGAHYNCPRTKVSDIAIDCDGATQSPPLSGFLCQFKTNGGASVVLMQDNGRSCLQSNLFSPTTPSKLSVNTIAAWTDARTVLGTDQQTPAHIWSAQHVVNDYSEMPVDVHPATNVVDTKMVYTDLGPAQANVSQIIALGGPAGAAMNTGLWPSLGFETVMEDHDGLPLFQYNTGVGGGDGMCLKAWSNVSGTIISTMAPYGSYPISYVACHAAPSNGGGYVFVGTQAANHQLSPAIFSSATTLGGPFISNVIGVRKNGSWVNTSLTISSCTKANPAVCTSTGHNLDNTPLLSSTAGALITISGATGTGWVTGLNATLYAHRVDNNTFSLYTDPRIPLPLTTTSSSATTYTATGNPTLTVLTNGVRLLWDVGGTACTAGPVTLNVDSLGAKSVFESDGITNPVAGDCTANKKVQIVYNGTAFTIIAGTALDSSGFGTLGGTITGIIARPIYSLGIQGVTGTTTARIAIDNTDAGAVAYYPTLATSGITNIMFDADPITIVQGTMNSTTQYYAKVSCSLCSNVQFDLYSDAALSIPVSTGSLGTVTGFYVLYAERCPDPAGITLPGPMFTDTMFGTTGAGNQKIRCIGVRLNSEMESNFPNNTPTPSEHTSYPPPATSTEFGNVNKSMLHQINVGDGMMDMTHIGGAHEIMYTLSVDRSVSENQIDVVVERGYGDDPNYLWRGADCTICNGFRRDTYAFQHSPGWTAIGTGIVGSVLLDPSVNPPTYVVPPFNQAHSDLVSGATGGSVTSAGGYVPGNADDVVDVSVSTYVSSFTSVHNSAAIWNSDGTYNWTGLRQSYPSKRNIFSQTAATERVWKSDWAAPNIDNGTGKNNLDGSGYTRTLTNVSGIVWKIQSLSSINIKVSPITASAYPYNYFTDASGPGTWSKANGTMCYPYAANECVSGTSAGDQYIYIASTTLQTVGQSGLQCFSNDATVGAPCAFGVWPGYGWALQIQQTPTDTNATHLRRLTQGFWPGLGQYYASNWVASSDAKWGFFADTPMGQRPHNSIGGSNFFAMKLPPWPTSSDGVDRTKYVQIPIPLGGITGDSVRLEFGYGENGDPASFFCTTRQEACWTTNAPTGTAPFDFNGETAHKTACSPSCTVPIPMIPGRILFYRLERTNGATVTLGPIQTIDDSGAVPSGGSIISGKMVIGGKIVVH